MSTPSPTLEEQQQGFMRAQLMMATRITPLRKPPPAPSPFPATAITPHCATAISPSVEPSSRNAKASRRRKSSSSSSSSGKKPTSGFLAGVQPWPVEDARAPRKPPHVLQKEQRQALIDEVRELEAHVEQLRRRAGLPTKTDRNELMQERVVSAKLDEAIDANRQYTIQLKSEVMEELQFPPVNTLATYIHLPCDMEQRRAILLGMRDTKIRRAAETGLARFQHIDHHISCLSQEQFTLDDGVFRCHRWEVVAYPNFNTARQAFDALFFFIYNMEISVTEMVNQVAVREDDHEFDPTIWNHHIVTTTEDIGCVEEVNMVGFANFFDKYDPLDGAPLGVIVLESVDEDDLYPYVPSERTRRSFQTFHLFCEVVDPVTKQTSVVKKSCLLGSQLPPEFPLDPALLAKLQEYTPRWDALMNQYLRDYAVPKPS